MIMHSHLFYPIALLAYSLVVCAQVWTTLPPTPSLAQPINDTLTPLDGVNLWIQKYNEGPGVPIVLLHGGLGYSAYFADVAKLLAESHYVILTDRRGHGRSTYLPSDLFTFDEFARETYEILKAQGVTESIWVGWSDGGITTMAGLLNEEINASISKAFLYGATQSPSDTNASFANTAIYSEFISRCQTEWTQLHPNGNFTDFGLKVATLENTLPTWSDADLGRIDGSKVMIADGDHEEAVNLAVPAHLQQVIPGSQLKILTGVSHFGPMQDPNQFAQAVEDFL